MTAVMYAETLDDLQISDVLILETVHQIPAAEIYGQNTKRYSVVGINQLWVIFIFV
jgi:hypothetical protein